MLTLNQKALYSINHPFWEIELCTCSCYYTEISIHQEVENINIFTSWPLTPHPVKALYQVNWVALKRAFVFSGSLNPYFFGGQPSWAWQILAWLPWAWGFGLGWTFSRLLGFGLLSPFSDSWSVFWSLQLPPASQISLPSSLLSSWRSSRG